MLPIAHPQVDQPAGDSGTHRWFDQTALALAAR